MSSQESILNGELLLPPKSVLEKSIFHFLLNLMRKIFLKSKESTSKVDEHLEKYLDKINKNIIKINEKYINTDYSISNFKNIINFVKGQNKTLAGDIIEGILILIFSLVFQADKTDTFGEFLYKNTDKTKNKNYDYKLESSENFDLVKWFKQELFLPKELNNIRLLLEKDNRNEIGNALLDSPLYYLLLEIQNLKYIDIKNKNENKKIDQFIYRRNFKDKKVIDNNFTNNFRSNKIIRFFFISVFIYYQNKHSPLMKYIKEEKEHPVEYKYKGENGEEIIEVEKKFYAGIPFEYSLCEANLENKFANSVLSPGRIEPRIEHLIMSENNLEERGFFELSKILIFNKYIKKCSFDTSTIKSHYLDYLNLGLGLYDNTTLEELNLFYNNINKDSQLYLTKIIYHLKGLKTINLSSNDLRKGASSFFVMLKQLYRQGKTKLENLVLNKCSLDNSSLYELGELLKCPYCKLKRLYLSCNSIPENTKLLNKLKKNKYLTEIYLNKCSINDDSTDDIMRLISNTHLQTIYLHKNNLTNFINCFRIIFRTKLIKKIQNKDEKEKIGHSAFLMNLDLSDNPIYNKNLKDLILLEEIIAKTTLYSLDISHFLNGLPQEKMRETEENKDYRNKISEIKDNLNKDIEQYKLNVDEKNTLEVDKQEIEENINNYKAQILEDKEFNEDILKKLLEKLLNSAKLINDENAVHPLFLREKAKDFIGDIVKDEQNEFYSLIKNKISKKNEKGEEIIDIENYKKIENFLKYSMSLKKVENDYDKIKDFKEKHHLIII